MDGNCKGLVWAPGLVKEVFPEEVASAGIVSPHEKVSVQRPFQATVKLADIANVRFHDLTHCAASYLFMTGADPRTVMQILGHRDPRMTLRVYAMVSTKHFLFPDVQSEVNPPEEYGNVYGVRPYVYTARQFSRPQNPI